MIKINERNQAIYFIDGYEIEIVDFINKNKVSKIIFSSEYVSKDTKIDFLVKTTSIDTIIVTTHLNIDVNVLYKLKIKSLLMSIGEYPIDFSQMKYIEDVNVIHNIKMNFNELSASLKKITINEFKNTSLNTFPSANCISDLWITQSKILSLEGLNKFSNLEKIKISSSSKLSNIDDLKYLANKIKYLELEKCKSLSDFSVLQELTNIEEISLYNVGSVSTTAYFKSLSKLKTLFLRGSTKVLEQNKEDVSHINKVVIADMDLMIGCQ
jgi:hypothetical protein